MDDTRIKELTEEVLGALYRRGPAEPGAPGGPASALEARLASLEARLQQVQGGAGAPSVTAVAVAAPNSTATAVVTAQIATHPALQLLNVSGSTDGRCVLDPDQPCVKSGACRTFGH